VVTVTDRFNSFPPILVRLLARQDCRPLATAVIAAESGLSRPKVEFISQQTDWKEVSLTDALGFLEGCDLAIDHTAAWRRTLDYLSKRPTFRYLRASSDWKSYYEPMLKKWLETYLAAPGYLCPPVGNLVKRLSPVANRGVGAKFQKV
jgi:hypothetical protein